MVPPDNGRDLAHLVPLSLAMLSLSVDQLTDSRMHKNTVATPAADFTKPEPLKQANKVSKRHVADVPLDDSRK